MVWLTLFHTDCVSRNFFNGHSGPLTLCLCSCLLYLSIREVFKWLMCVFKCVGWESIRISTQDFKGIFLIGDERGLTSKAVLQFCSRSTTAWNNALPSLSTMTSHTSGQGSPAFWTNSDISGRGHFFPSIYLHGIQMCTPSAMVPIARIESLHWILDISSNWSTVLYFSARIKCKHGC